MNLSNTPEGASLQATIAASGENNVVFTWLDNQTGSAQTYVTANSYRPVIQQLLCRPVSKSAGSVGWETDLT
jgi:hypothetical protein